jgi:hypothetical protein
MYICMPAFMHLCICACMYVCMYVCMRVCKCVCLYAYMLHMHVCFYFCMYCMDVWVLVCVFSLCGRLWRPLCNFCCHAYRCVDARLGQVISSALLCSILYDSHNYLLVEFFFLCPVCPHSYFVNVVLLGLGVSHVIASLEASWKELAAPRGALFTSAARSVSDVQVEVGQTKA